MAFDEIRFPAAISLGGSGGPERRTDVVITGSGREERNARWTHSRRRYNAGYGLRSLDDVHTAIAFFEERRGRLHGFRWKDHTDWKSCAPGQQPSAVDQAIGAGDGATASFQLVKSYGTGLRNYSRIISKPVLGTVLAAVNGTPSTAFTLNSATGVITLNAGNIPAVGAAVTAGFEFDVPVRFDTDRLSINLAAFAAGDIPEIPLVEIIA
ncbi:MAG: TIGR02217 family protein [Aestuariivirga sp.]